MAKKNSKEKQVRENFSKPGMINQVLIGLIMCAAFLGLLNIIFATLGANGIKSQAKNGKGTQNQQNAANQDDKQKDDGGENKPVAFASEFAEFKDTPVNVTPKNAAYQIKSDLSNVKNAAKFNFSPEAKELLVKNGFVVVPDWQSEFYPLYEGNRYSYIPNFVTTDSILHNYHLMFDYLLRKLEEEKLIAELKSLNQKMLIEAIGQYDELKGTEWENATKRNIGFFAVGGKLLDANVNVPGLVKNEVEKELSYISAHQGIEISPVMNIGNENLSPEDLLKEDYSQYVPRGHYDKTEDLKRYFNSMMWYGRLTFRLKNDEEVKSAILISLKLNNEDNRRSWDKIYEPINFFVGKSDDIGYYQFDDLIEKTYGQNPSLIEMANNKEKFSSFIKLAKDLEPPQINSMPIFDETIQPNREEEIKGFRFLGQRFTIDASIFQRLVYREVKENPDGKKRMLPKGLDIPAAMGSSEALKILESMGETTYEKYPENMGRMKAYLADLDQKNWTQNLYWGWLYSLLPLTQPKSEGYPSFMTNDAWTRKDLNSFLGSWTELKHDTILYAKQVYAELGGGGPQPDDDRGYVEPNIYVYARLVSLLNMTRDGLADRDLLTEVNKDNLEKMSQLALSLKDISEKELNNENLTDEEYELIKSYGGQIEHFWIEVNKEEEGFGTRDYLRENPAAIIADVATDPNGSVLEEGTGNIFQIYAVVPVAGELRIASGGVYSYYEFAHPMSDRLTDKKWRELLESDKAPKLPEWTSKFLAQ